jgi:hypothetical protein
MISIFVFCFRSKQLYCRYISYLELYNDKGYDLLDSNRDESRKLEDLPQVLSAHFHPFRTNQVTDLIFFSHRSFRSQ